MSLLSQPERDDSSRPAVLLLYFLRDNYLETTERQLYDSLRNNAALLEARDPQVALQHLKMAPPPQAVLVADALMSPKPRTDLF
ncbi:hypothetical protein TRAPUB_1899 [Trametes pubescens]|uniref:Uncharacterized protein n=1 Tax=Trametes pubescens TaxID=154538 RepID=A0A1M2VI17_TRAPU|nr:hypothetical protein TRAPUB_1899 [Trametes pubescens]